MRSVAPALALGNAVILKPDLQTALQTYALIYAETYGVEEPITELVPAMLASFLESDRSFARQRDARQRGQK